MKEMSLQNLLEINKIETQKIVELELFLIQDKNEVFLPVAPPQS